MGRPHSTWKKNIWNISTLENAPPQGSFCTPSCKNAGKPSCRSTLSLWGSFANAFPGKGRAPSHLRWRWGMAWLNLGIAHVTCWLPQTKRRMSTEFTCSWALRTLSVHLQWTHRHTLSWHRWPDISATRTACSVRKGVRLGALVTATLQKEQDAHLRSAPSSMENKKSEQNTQTVTVVRLREKNLD